MASEEGVVIACHTKADFDAHMAKAKEAGKLVRAPRASSSPIPICLSSRAFCLHMPPIYCVVCSESLVIIWY